jgi:hypothetical protein
VTSGSVGFQASFDAPFDATYAYAVGPRTTEFSPEPQPAYVALSIGGHAGVRMSLKPEQARDLAALLLRVLDEGLPAEVDVNGSIVRVTDVQPVPA